MNRHSIILIATFTAVLSGCASAPRKQTRAEQPAPPIQAQISVQPAVQNYPQPPPPAVPAGGFQGYEANPVYRSPVVRMIHLEPYMDAEGNAYGPQVKYQIEDPGGWNMSALRNPSTAYVPTNMTPQMPQMSGHVVAYTGQDRTPAPTLSLRELYKIDDIEVLGFVERSQEPLAAEAEKRKGNTHIRYFDEKLGWMLIPKAALSKISG